MARRSVFLILAMALACLTAWAQPETGSYTRLARLSYIEGHVSYQHTSDVDWSAASINLPLEPGDRLYTGRDGRAEVEFDDGSIYRLAEDTDVEILSLNEDLIQLRMLVGLSTLNVSSGLDFEIDTPAAAFNTIREGVYRFGIAENGDTDAIVRKGELEAASNEFSRRIDSGAQMHLRVGGGPIVARYDTRDAWDEWNDRRNADLRAYASREYIPDNVYIGVSDLDQYGRWEYVGSYGYGWVPFSAGVSWSPYSVGRWCYRPLYGWTWVSYEPWGWLPFHYGRWYHSVSFGWCWLPGPAFSFNFWSPGLVSFYSGPGWVSWCPLGPGDYYNVDHYHYNRGIYGYQLGRLRALYTRAPGDPFNRNVRGAFRTAQIDHFRNGSFHNNRPGSGWDRVSQPWREGTFVRDRLPVRPTATSYRADPDRSAVRPRAANSLPAVVRNMPGTNRSDRGRLNRITNPQFSSSPSREARNRNEQGETRNSGVSARSNARINQSPSSGRTNQGVRGQAGNGHAEQGGRRMTTPRSSTQPGYRSTTPAPDTSPQRAPAARPRTETSRPDNNTQQRTRGTTPARNTSPQRAAPAARPRTETSRPNNNPQQRSWSTTPAPITAPRQEPTARPRAEPSPSYRSTEPRSSFTRPSNSSNAGSWANRGEGYSRSYGSSWQSSRPAAGQNNVTRSIRVPSGGSYASPSGRSFGGSSAGRSSGGTRSAPARSSGGGRGRR